MRVDNTRTFCALVEHLKARRASGAQRDRRRREARVEMLSVVVDCEAGGVCWRRTSRRRAGGLCAEKLSQSSSSGVSSCASNCSLTLRASLLTFKTHVVVVVVVGVVVVVVVGVVVLKNDRF